MPDSLYSSGARGTSPASSGPAGSHFEGQVGAFYLLALLCGASPRGLPGTVISRVKLQQANMAHPLDDVVVHAHDLSGREATLEIQVKREITFAPTDTVFKKVIGQIVEASSGPDFESESYQFAIATAKGSHKINGAYQDVLMMARQIGEPLAFKNTLDLKGAANDDMRTFVQTFRTHLRDHGSADDDRTVWNLLRKLQILVFDFTAPGSASEDLARERAARCLHADEQSRAIAFWSILVEQALEIAKASGSRDRQSLLESLQPHNFRFNGERRNATARRAMAEEGALAIESIHDRVGNLRITRRRHVDAVRDALDRSRYVEIRGDGGVGKSGVLRHVAEQSMREGQTLVLAPDRCVPRGWPAMASQFGFEGLAREFFVDLANDGGAILFVDNVDSFAVDERTTVVDLVREASKVSGVSVVVTARPSFGIEQPNWLPADALNRLGQSTVIVDELDDTDIEQLCAGDPKLVPLLAEDHPARNVARNLFRLDRLASLVSGDPLPHTEAEMALQWWRTADGIREDATWHERSRLLEYAASTGLSGGHVIDVRSQSPSAIIALSRSGTLQSLDANRVIFRHDVLREWATASLIVADITVIEQLLLEYPASPTLARGLELAARMAIETASDAKPWRAIVNLVSRAGAHPSWRRAALLALVRTEVEHVALMRALPELDANDGQLLRELLRVVNAVEVTPAATLFAGTGVDTAILPAGMNVPRHQSWSPLILWLLARDQTVPPAAIPEIVTVYMTYSVGTLGLSPAIPGIARAFFGWLVKLGPVRFTVLDDDTPWTGLSREELSSLREDLFFGFVLFSKHAPELATQYLSAAKPALRHFDEMARKIIKLPGTLVEAAPAELADFVADALIEVEEDDGETYRGDLHRRAFTFLDSDFIPPSPAQGPFFAILNASPKEGLALARRLVDHAISFSSDGVQPGSNVIRLRLPDGEREFPWAQSYFWSRTSNFYGLTSALMAVEAWAHRRIDAGEKIEAVIRDVLGAPGAPAAYLLIAVDLVISHWPKSIGIATAFVSCPELLCLDHQRQALDQFERPKLFQDILPERPEPRGPTSLAELAARPSRGNALSDLIGRFVLTAPETQNENLLELLREAAARVGPYSARDDLGDPTFMAAHALNLADLANWPEITVKLKDNSEVVAHRYQAPDVERQHLEALQAAAAPKNSDFSVQSAVRLAVEKSAQLTAEQRADAVNWARGARAAPSECSASSGVDHSTEERMLREAIVGVAMIVMRDGEPNLLDEHFDWAKETLLHVLATEERDVARLMRNGLSFNPNAIAFAGLIYALGERPSPQDVEKLLAVAGGEDASVAHGFGAAVQTLHEVDDRLSRSLLRCAFGACIWPEREWDLPAEKVAARAARRGGRSSAMLAAEIDWLYGDGPEPTWPAFPQARRSVRRRRLTLSPELDPVAESDDADEEAPTEYVDHQTAALWLRQAAQVPNLGRSAWLSSLVKAYLTWTLSANGAGFDEYDEVSDAPREWNLAFFSLVASAAPVLSNELNALIVEPVCGLPEKHFADVAPTLLRALDVAYFTAQALSDDLAVAVRQAFATRLRGTNGWRRMVGDRSMSVNRDFAEVVATIFFNDYNMVRAANCYLYEAAVNRIGPFLGTIQTLAVAGPSPFVGTVLMNLVEVAPRAEQLPLLFAAAKAWLDSYAGFRPFWIDQAIGRRWCQALDKIFDQSPTIVIGGSAARAEADYVLAALVGLGVPEANQLEDRLRRAG